MMVWSQLHHMWQGPISPATQHPSSVLAHTTPNIHIHADNIWVGYISYYILHITCADIYYRQWQDILDILNAPEIGLLLITWPYLILLTGHCRHHHYYCHYHHSVLYEWIKAEDLSLPQTTSPRKEGWSDQLSPPNAKTTKCTKWQGSQKSCQQINLGSQIPQSTIHN